MGIFALMISLLPPLVGRKEGRKEEANLDVRLLHAYKGEGDLHEMSEFLSVSADKQLHKCFEHLALSEFGSASIVLSHSLLKLAGPIWLF